MRRGVALLSSSLCSDSRFLTGAKRPAAGLVYAALQWDSEITSLQRWVLLLILCVCRVTGGGGGGGALWSCVKTCNYMTAMQISKYLVRGSVFSLVVYYCESHISKCIKGISSNLYTHLSGNWLDLGSKSKCDLVLTSSWGTLIHLASRIVLGVIMGVKINVTCL